MHTFETIHSDLAPAAVGPYSQAVRAGSLVMLSGQIGIDPHSGALVSGDIAAQTRQAMENLHAVLCASGLDFSNVVRADIFITAISEFSRVNEVYASYFPGHYKPARQTVEVSALPREALVEISLIAVEK